MVDDLEHLASCHVDEGDRPLRRVWRTRCPRACRVCTRGSDRSACPSPTASRSCLPATDRSGPRRSPRSRGRCIAARQFGSARTALIACSDSSNRSDGLTSSSSSQDTDLTSGDRDDRLDECARGVGDDDDAKLPVDRIAGGEGPDALLVGFVQTDIGESGSVRRCDRSRG